MSQGNNLISIEEVLVDLRRDASCHLRVTLTNDYYEPEFVELVENMRCGALAPVSAERRPGRIRVRSTSKIKRIPKLFESSHNFTCQELNN